MNIYFIWLICRYSWWNAGGLEFQNVTDIPNMPYARIAQLTEVRRLYHIWSHSSLNKQLQPKSPYCYQGERSTWSTDWYLVGFGVILRPFHANFQFVMNYISPFKLKFKNKLVTSSPELLSFTWLFMHS